MASMTRSRPAKRAQTGVRPRSDPRLTPTETADITFRSAVGDLHAPDGETADPQDERGQEQQPENRSWTRGGSGGRRQQPDQRRGVIVHRRRDGTQRLQVVQDAHLLHRMRKDAVGPLPGEQHGRRDNGIADVHSDREKDAPVTNAAERGQRPHTRTRVPCSRHSSRLGLRPHRAARPWPQTRAGHRRRRSRQTQSARQHTRPRAAPHAGPARETRSAAPAAAGKLVPAYRELRKTDRFCWSWCNHAIGNDRRLGHRLGQHGYRAGHGSVGQFESITRTSLRPAAFGVKFN